MKRALPLCAAFALTLLFSGCGQGTAPPPEEPGGTLLPPTVSEPVDLEPEAPKAKVILLAGEGNCVGNTYSYFLRDKQNPAKSVTAEKYAEYANGYENVLISYRNEIRPGTLNAGSKGFVPVKLGQGRSNLSGYENGMFGPEVGLAEYFANRYEETTYIIKYGGDGLSRLAVEWSPAGGGYYTGMVSYFNEALSTLKESGVEFEVPAILFLQGESDTFSDPDIYSAGLVALSTALREEFSEYAPDNGIAFIDAGLPTYYPNSDGIDALKRANARADERNYFLDATRAGLTHDRDSRNRRYWDAMSELKLGNLLGNLVQESLGYRLHCATLRGTGTMPELPADGYELLACADGEIARSSWKISAEGGLTVQVSVEDSRVTAEDGIELTVAPAVRQKALADGTVKFTATAAGKQTFSVLQNGVFGAADGRADCTVELYDGGYVLRASLPASVLPAGKLSLSFALRNRNATLHTVSYAALGTDPSRAYTYMRIEGSRLSAGYAQLGETFGDGGTLRAKEVWDLSRDNGTQGASAQMFATDADNDLYFYRRNEQTLFAEVALQANAVLNGERWGKFGIKVTTEENAGLFFYVDAWGNGTDMQGCSLGYATFKNGTWNNDWTNFSATPISSSAEYTAGFIRLGLRRTVDTYEFYCNGQLLATLEDPALIGNAKAYFGLASFNIMLTARNYSLSA